MFSQNKKSKKFIKVSKKMKNKRKILKNLKNKYPLGNKNIIKWKISTNLCKLDWNNSKQKQKIKKGKTNQN